MIVLTTTVEDAVQAAHDILSRITVTVVDVHLTMTHARNVGIARIAVTVLHVTIVDVSIMNHSAIIVENAVIVVTMLTTSLLAWAMFVIVAQMDFIGAAMTTEGGEAMAKCKFHFCNNAAANDCDFNLCGECCCGCSRHETRSGPIEADEHTSCCVCGYDFTEFDITLEDHQKEGTPWCDHLTQYKKEEENGYVYAYCACCEKCLGLATW